MKKWFFSLLLFFSFSISAQIITTVASSGIYDVNGLVFDTYGNLYITTLLGNQIKKMDTSGVITTIAGTGSAGYFGDGGLATNAQLNQPCGITVDTLGNIFFADVINQRIRKIDMSTGIISTIAGIGPGGYGTGGFSGDSGMATTAALNGPASVCFDYLGNLYIADALNRRIRKINTSGIINTIAGNGSHGSIGDGGLAILAECSPNGDILADNGGNLYFTENGSVINKVRKINSFGIISKIAGDTTSYIYNGDFILATNAHLNPSFLAIDANYLLYISDVYNNRIRRIDSSGIIYTIAGNGMSTHSGDSGLAISAAVNQPSGLAFDHCGNLYIGEVGGPAYIRKVALNPACWPAEVNNITPQNIFIYPNPATEEINVDNVKAPTKYALLNITGIIEQRGTLKAGTNSISVQSLPPGMYMLVLTDNEGIKTVKKIIKE